MANLTRSPTELKTEAEGLFRLRVLDAIERFPHYAAKVKEHRGSLPRPGELFTPDELPLWSKPEQRRLFNSQVRPPIAGAFPRLTGGSTGVPVRYHVSRESYEWRIAVWERGYTWAGATPLRTSVHLWGVPLAKAHKADFKEQLQFWLWRRTVIDTYQSFDESRKELCCRVINNKRPDVLVGYTGALVELAHYVRARPDRLRWRAQIVVPAAETVQPGHRELLEETLGKEVSLSYGSTEFMLIGMECRHHRGYHLSSDNLLVEITDERGVPVPPGKPGLVVITDLHNAASPFIRYVIEDVASLSPETCPCGLPFPLLGQVEGRSQDTIRTPDGGTVPAIFIGHVVKTADWMERFQVVQDTLDHILIKVVASEEPTPERTRSLDEKLRVRLGAGTRIEWQRVSALEKTRSGKTLLVISTLDDPTASPSDSRFTGRDSSP